MIFDTKLKHFVCFFPWVLQPDGGLMNSTGNHQLYIIYQRPLVYFFSANNIRAVNSPPSVFTGTDHEDGTQHVRSFNKADRHPGHAPFLSFSLLVFRKFWHRY